MYLIDKAHSVLVVHGTGGLAMFTSLLERNTQWRNTGDLTLSVEGGCEDPKVPLVVQHA